MKIYTYEEFCRTISQEEAIIFMSYVSNDIQKMDINGFKHKFGDVFHFKSVIYMEHLCDDGMRPLEIEVLYNYQHGFMKCDVIQVTEYNNRYELDLLFKAQNLISEYVSQPH